MSPFTLLEFSLSDTNNYPDYYDVSLFDGFNVPAIIVPISSSSKCNSTGCAVDMNSVSDGAKDNKKWTSGGVSEPLWSVPRTIFLL